jgi:hypothetical protein
MEPTQSPLKIWLHEKYSVLEPLIRAERQRQIDIEGHTRAKDAGKAEQLRAAAKSYQRQAIALDLHPGILLSLHTLEVAGDPWPWADEFWKPTRDIDRNLVKAGALMMAAQDAEAR